MPALSYSALNQNVHPQPAWRFYATMPTVGSLNGQLLSFLVESFNAPMVGINFEEVAINAGTRYFPSLRTLGQIQMVLAENTQLQVIQYLRAWKDLVIDDQGNFGLPSQWKKAIQLQPIDETGASNGPALSWQGCGPALIDALNFDGSATRHVSVSATFMCDSMDPF